MWTDANANNETHDLAKDAVAGAERLVALFFYATLIQVLGRYLGTHEPSTVVTLPYPGLRRQT